MRKQGRNSIRKALPAASLVLGLIPVMSMAADSCSTQLDDIKTRVINLASKADGTKSSVQKDFESASSKNYAQTYFDKFEKLNQSAKDATQLVNSGYKLAGFTTPMKEGQIQTKLPTKVTNTMSNAEELAQAAMNEDNTKLDLAQIRCSQSTEDAALSAALDKMDSSTVSKFKTGKNNACKVVHVLADLQDKRQKLNDLRENGYPLFFLHAKDTKDFSGYTRTIQLKADLRLFPVYPDKAMAVDGKDQPILLGQIEGINLSYNSYFKWSDDNWTTLNLYQYLIGDTKKDEICQPQIKLTSSVKVALCVKVEDVTSENIKLKVRAKYWYKDDSSAVSLGTKTVPAPFGYLADVSDMKEKKMQDLQSLVVDRMASLLGDYGDTLKKADSWKKSCDS